MQVAPGSSLLESWPDDSAVSSDDSALSFPLGAVCVIDVPIAAFGEMNEKLLSYVLTHESVTAMHAQKSKPDRLAECICALAAPEQVLAYSRALTAAQGEFAEAPWIKMARRVTSPTRIFAEVISV